jgi:hypothetical protein
MRLIGKVVAILDDNQVLVKLDPGCSLPANYSVLTVFDKTEIASLKAEGLDQLYFPKGEIRALLSQGEEFFLAERYRESREETKVVPKRTLATPLADLFDLTENVKVTVQGPWSADLDQEKSLKIVKNPLVTIGDVVGYQG